MLQVRPINDIGSPYKSHSPGAVFLPLRCAQEFDATNEGREYWLVGCPAGDADPRKLLYERRWACYRICVDSLSAFDDRLADVIKKGEPGLEQDAARTRAYQLAFESQDYAFHCFFYDWLIDRGMTEELLEVCDFPRACNSEFTWNSTGQCSWKITCRGSQGPSINLTSCGNTTSKLTSPFVLRRSSQTSRNLQSQSQVIPNPLVSPLTV
jgi:Non-repetitive/WGA-negative nucleoporin C-terminal